MDPRFGQELRRLRDLRGLSQPALAKLLNCDQSYISHVENWRRIPPHDMARRFDDVLGAGGVLIALVPPPVCDDEADPWETAELMFLLNASHAGKGAIEHLQQTAERLCCEYSTKPPAKLRAEAQKWLRYTNKLVKKGLSLSEHRDVAVAGGWLGLLVGCLEHDLGLTGAAESTRLAALDLGQDAKHSEIIGWAWEMAAWMALTRGDPLQVLEAARVGQEASRGYTVSGQLAGLEAKALARLGRGDEIHAALERGHDVLSSAPPSVRSRNHFVVDAGKFEFLAMDCYRVAGDDERATECAEMIIGKYVLPDGTELSPMRVSEARMTLAVVAARAGDTDAAMSEALRALSIERKSVPSLTLPARELLRILLERYPDVGWVETFAHQIRTLTAA